MSFISRVLGKEKSVSISAISHLEYRDSHRLIASREMTSACASLIILIIIADFSSCVVPMTDLKVDPETSSG